MKDTRLILQPDARSRRPTRRRNRHQNKINRAIIVDIGGAQSHLTCRRCRQPCKLSLCPRPARLLVGQINDLPVLPERLQTKEAIRIRVAHRDCPDARQRLG